MTINDSEIFVENKEGLRTNYPLWAERLKMDYPLLYPIPEDFLEKTFVIEKNKEALTFLDKSGLYYKGEKKLTSEEQRKYSEFIKNNKYKELTVQKTLKRIPALKKLKNKPIKKLSEGDRLAVEYLVRVGLARLEDIE